MKNILSLLACLSLLCLPALADTTTITLATDAQGKATDGDAVPFGIFKLSSFVADGSFMNVQVLLDGNAIYDGQVIAGQTYAVSGSAKSQVSLAGTGGPANATVTVTINYTWTPFATESRDESRTVETFTLTTDADGNATDSDAIPLGTLKLNTFNSTASFNDVKITIGSGVVFQGPVTAEQPYTVGKSGKTSLALEAKGGPANTTVTITVDYTLSPFRAEEPVASDARTVESFDIVTDANGKASDSDAIPLGTLKLNSFKSTQSFGKVQILIGGASVYSGPVAAGQTYTVGKSGKKTLALECEGGPANATASITVDYTLSPFREARDSDAFELKTDAAGKASVKDEIPFGVFNLTNFSCAESFGNVKVLIDEKSVFDGAVVAGQVYKAAGKGKKSVAVVAEGGLANSVIIVTVNYNWTPFRDFRDIESFTVMTDGSGNATDGDSIPFGVFKLSSFTATESFASVKVLLDGNAIFEKPVEAGKTYGVTGSGKKTISLVCEGGPANAEVTVSVNYTWGPFRK